MIRFLSIFIVILLLAGCGKNPQKAASSSNTSREYPSQEGWNSTYRVTRAGLPQAVIRYGHMAKYDNQATYYFDQGVKVDFFDETGRHTSVLTSERGKYQEQTGDVYGMGNVVIVSDTGVTVLTEKIRWDERRDKIISDTLATIIEQKGDTLYCEGFVSNPDLSKIVFHKPRGNSQRRIDFDRIEDALTSETERDSVQLEGKVDTALTQAEPDSTFIPAARDSLP